MFGVSIKSGTIQHEVDHDRCSSSVLQAHLILNGCETGGILF